MGMTMAHDAGEGRERGKPQNAVLFLPCCELSSTMTQLNKTHTWFIFGLAPPASLCSPPKLIYGAIVLYSDLPHQKLWALQLRPCSFHHAGVTAVKVRERTEREEGNRRENKGKKLRLHTYTSAFWLIQGMAHPYGSLFIANIPYKLATFFLHPPPPFPPNFRCPRGMFKLLWNPRGVCRFPF